MEETMKERKERFVIGFMDTVKENAGGMQMMFERVQKNGLYKMKVKQKPTMGFYQFYYQNTVNREEETEVLKGKKKEMRVFGIDDLIINGVRNAKVKKRHSVERSIPVRIKKIRLNLSKDNITKAFL